MLITTAQCMDLKILEIKMMSIVEPYFCGGEWKALFIVDQRPTATMDARIYQESQKSSDFQSIGVSVAVLSVAVTQHTKYKQQLAACI